MVMNGWIKLMTIDNALLETIQDLLYSTACERKDKNYCGFNPILPGGGLPEDMKCGTGK